MMVATSFLSVSDLLTPGTGQAQGNRPFSLRWLTGETLRGRRTMPMPTVFPAAKTSSPFASWRGDHAGIRVPDVDAAIALYTEKLDFRMMHTMPYGDDAAVQISRSNAALPSSARHHLWPLPSATSPNGGTYLPARARAIRVWQQETCAQPAGRGHQPIRPHASSSRQFANN